MKKFLIVLTFLLVLVESVQSQLPTCTSGKPPCYNDQVPYAGHGPASNLPLNLCNTCSGDNSRVIVVRIDPSWGATTNANVWNATNCAIDEWNNATDANGNKTGYHFVLDQANQTARLSIPRNVSDSYLVERVMAQRTTVLIRPLDASLTSRITTTDVAVLTQHPSSLMSWEMELHLQVRLMAFDLT